MEMASPGNRHCANGIGTVSFPIPTRFSDLVHPRLGPSAVIGVQNTGNQ